MPNFRVTIMYDACTTHDVTADDERDAVRLGHDSAGVSLCNYCSDKIELGDPIRAVVVENLETGESNEDPEPDHEVVALRQQVAELQGKVTGLTEELENANWELDATKRAREKLQADADAAARARADGRRIYAAMVEQAKARTSPENVSDVLDAFARVQQGG
jgi:Tfp pilus assembly protein FimV